MERKTTKLRISFFINKYLKSLFNLVSTKRIKAKNYKQLKDLQYQQSAFPIGKKELYFYRC